MNNFCYTLSVRQRKCQNVISNITDNVYTNISNNSVVQLGFGYTLTFISSNSSTATIQLSNPDVIPNILFNIPNGSYKIFDLPVDSGTVRIYVGVTAIDCSNTIACCNII